MIADAVRSTFSTVSFRQACMDLSEEPGIVGCRREALCSADVERAAKSAWRSVGTRECEQRARRACWTRRKPNWNSSRPIPGVESVQAAVHAAHRCFHKSLIENTLRIMGI